MVKRSMKSSNATAINFGDEERLHRVLDQGFDSPVDDFDLLVRGVLCSVSSRFSSDDL